MGVDMGGFANAIGQGISGLVGGSLRAISQAFGSMVASASQILPFPWLPIVAGGLVLFVAWRVLRR
jgi:hypothetical protein